MSTKSKSKRASTLVSGTPSGESSPSISLKSVSAVKETLIEQAINFPKVDDQNIYSSEVAIQKNLLLLGKAGAGKTTLLEVLKSPKYVTPTSQSLFAGIRLDPEYTPLVVRNQSGKAFSLNVIDTPGLFEVRANVKEKRTNAQIFDLIEENLRENLTKISAIFILIPAASTLNEEDLEMLKLVKEFLGESFTKNTFLVFTKSDMFKLETLKIKITEFLESAISQPFVEFCQGGIYFSGAVCGELAGEYGETYVEKTQEKVFSLRQYLVDAVVATQDKKLPATFGLAPAVNMTTGNEGAEPKRKKEKEAK